MPGSDAPLVAVYADESCLGNGREGANPGGAGQVSTENNRICRSARKGWRFVHEMEEVVRTVEAAGLRANLFRPSLEIYRALSCFDPDAEPPSEAEVMAALLAASPPPSQKRG